MTSARRTGRYLLLPFLLSLLLICPATAQDIRSLDSIAKAKSYCGELDVAISLGQQVVEAQRQAVGEKHADYATALLNLAGYYSRADKAEEALRLGTEVLKIRKKLFGTESAPYAQALNHIAKYNSYLGHLKEAIKLGKEAVRLRAQCLGRHDADYAQSLSNLAGYYSRAGDAAEAVRLGTEALNIRRELFGEDHTEYAQSLNHLARYYSYTADLPEAVRLGRLAVEKRRSLLGPNNPDYAQSLSNLAGYLSRMGNYEEAIRLGTEALDIRRGLLGEAHTDYAQSVNNLAKYNYFLGNYAEAVRLGTEALHLREKYKGTKHPDYATALSNLADYNHRLGQFDEALRLGQQALKVRQDVLGRKHPDYALSLANMADYYCSAGRYREAAKYAADALKVREAVLGTDHPDYVSSLKVLALLHYRNGNMRECERLALMTSERYIHTILKTFAELTAEERNYFWKKTREWLTQDIYLLAHASPTPALVREAYDCTLLGKGLLLNCEIEMKRLLLESGDEEAVARYKELQDLKHLIWQQYERPIEERAFDADSLLRVAHGLERALVMRSKAYGDYTKNLQTDWQAVAGALGEGELAVEFVAFQADAGQKQYAALLLKRGMPAPKYVPLFTEQELAGISNSDCYMTPALAELVWKPMADELEGVEDIFFSPQGELHNMAVESLPDWQSDTLMSARWRFHRLSSTRELTSRREPARLEEAVIYGGMVYDLPGDKPFARGISYLPATRTEVEGIDSLLAAQHIATHIYTKAEGTEAGLKQRFVTGRHDRRSGILHIATHGFYWTPREAAQLDRKIRFLSLQERKRVSEEDKSLTRSGLFLSGANRALAGKADGDGTDDGVLTAKEIAALDFRSLDLVVLSACETALGEVKGDGVFGLQRGFKRAGAQSLLMSLWKVDDEATRLLMVKFYENLAEGMGKADALRAAQAFVRDYEVEVESEPQHRRKLSSRQRRRAASRTVAPLRRVRKYRNPRYWAAFILLDE